MKKSSDIYIGDLVLLSTQYLKLKDKPGRLHPVSVGPFQVIQDFKKNAIKPDLPAPISIHPVFNISLLKKCDRD